MKRKKRIANAVMVAVIVLIAAIGILLIGRYRGWFAPVEDVQCTACVTRDRGIVDMTRDGIAAHLEETSALRDGDQLSCNSGAQATVQFGESYLILGEKAVISIDRAAVDGFSVTVLSGEVYLSTKEAAAVTLGEQSFNVKDSTVTLSVRTGSESAAILSGTVTIGDKELSAGQLAAFAAKSAPAYTALKASSLSDFFLLCAQDSATPLCFSADELSQVLKDRQAQKAEPAPEKSDDTAGTSDEDSDDSADAGNADPDNTQASADKNTDSSENDKDTGGKDDASGSKPADKNDSSPADDNTHAKPDNKPADGKNGSKPDTPAKDEGSKPDKPADTDKPGESDKSDESDKPDKEPDTPAKEEKQPVALTCTIQIRCDTILDNMDNLEPGKDAYVPSSGTILSTTTVSFTEGETVFDVLKRVCDQNGIQLEYSYTPMYESYYIEGINYLYEFDCGNESGWMYKVNGWFPNYGCSDYTLEQGDSIVWCYTCNGLGADVGGGMG